MLSSLNIEKENISLLNTEFANACYSSAISVEALSHISTKRIAVERFIQRGYANTYHAKINVTTPFLIALEKGALKSALGIRSAKHTLFTEQYLENPIEQELFKLGIFNTRDEIAEIAHLYSNAKIFTVPLMLVTAVALEFTGVKTMVFTGTEHVINLIKKTGITVTKLVNADKSKLIKSDDQWGSYYDSNPVVVSIMLCDVLNAIQLSPKLLKMFEELSSQVAGVALQLERL